MVVTKHLALWFKFLVLLFFITLGTGIFLLGVSTSEWLIGGERENYFFLVVFLVHIFVGTLTCVPFFYFAWQHYRKARSHPNQTARRRGFILVGFAVLLLVSGLLLCRFDGFPQLTHPLSRTLVYVLHVAVALLVPAAYVMHRQAGSSWSWQYHSGVRALALAILALMILGHVGTRRATSEPELAEQPFEFAGTQVIGDLPFEAAIMANDGYCQECHADVHDTWQASAHRFSSFNNPIYRMSVEATMAALQARDGDDAAANFCAGCHDLVPLLTGRFTAADFDPDKEASAHSGITCTTCHSAVGVADHRGNGNLIFKQPQHYPFAFSDQPLLAYLNRQLIKAKPAFHKQSFLKPVHQETAFCGSCHKVHIPEALNGYRWLRGQNHFDSFWLSGVSGQGVASFYYPDKPQQNCNDCHMPTHPSDDFGSRLRAGESETTVRSHLFPGANTALAILTNDTSLKEAVKEHQAFLKDSIRVDLFSLRHGGNLLDGERVVLHETTPRVVPGETYLLEIVIRNLDVGHTFTQGTADSNEVWLQVELKQDQQVIAQSGGLNAEGSVDPSAHFFNAFVLDREGKRIDRRNVHDIFVKLYDHQIPPGAASTIFYEVTIPAEKAGTLLLEAAVHYRKFDATLMAIARKQGNTDKSIADLPITMLASDAVRLVTDPAQALPDPSKVPLWQRWNDYGIGLLRKGDKGPLKLAEQAFTEVERLGYAHGPVNLTRLYLTQGRIANQAQAALGRATQFEGPFAAKPWTLLWLAGQIHFQNGALDRAIQDFENILNHTFPTPAGFQFDRDYRLRNALGSAYFEKAKMLQASGKLDLLKRSKSHFQSTLAIDPENLNAHYHLSQIYRMLGNADLQQYHEAEHLRYKPDDHARDAAIHQARLRYPAANRAADPLNIYQLTPSEAAAHVP